MIKIEWNESLDELPRVRISRNELSVPEEMYGPIQSIFLTGRGKAKNRVMYGEKFKKPFRKDGDIPEKKDSSLSK